MRMGVSRGKTEDAVYKRPDFRVAGGVYIVFVVCVLSSSGPALGEFLLYAGMLFAAVRLSAVPLIKIVRGSVVIVPAVLALAIAIMVLKHGWITRLFAFWNIATKVFLVTVGTSFIVSFLKTLYPTRNPRVTKEDVRFFFIAVILIIEIRMWGG
jgi:hypothetical protein